MRWLMLEPCTTLLVLLEVLVVTNGKRIRQIHVVNNNQNNNKKPRAERQIQFSSDHDALDSNNNFRNIEGFEHYFNRNQFPPKVIQVTKTVQIHIPIAVPVETVGVRHQESQADQFSMQNNEKISSTVAPQKKSVRNGFSSPQPMSPIQPAKLNSVEMHNMQNSIWQQNFPPFPQFDMKSEENPNQTKMKSRPAKFKSSSSTTFQKSKGSEEPIIASILISQDPNTKAINIQIPGNAGIPDTFLDDIQKNPMGLLKSLKLTPIQSIEGPTSYDSPASGTPSNFLPSGYSSSTSSFNKHPSSNKQSPSDSPNYQTLFLESNMADSNFSEFSGNSFMPSFGDYLSSRPNIFSIPSDTVSSSSNTTKYLSSSKERSPKHYHTQNDQHSNTISHNAKVQYKTSYRFKNQPIDFNNFRDREPNKGYSFNPDTSLFADTFNKDDSRFSSSDVKATLREYEKQVEKEIFDATGMHSMKSSIFTSASDDDPTITPLVPLPFVSENVKKLKPLKTFTTTRKPREQKIKIKIKKS